MYSVQLYEHRLIGVNKIYFHKPVVCEYSNNSFTLQNLKMQLDLVNADQFRFGLVCLYVPSLSQRYNILTGTPKSSEKSFSL